MRIDSVSLENFRNIEALRFHPGEQVNIIYGDNAQGKTNLMEALWLLTGAKSFRGAKDAEITRFGAPFARIEALFWKEGRQQSAKICYEAKKTAELNEIPLPSVTGLTGTFCAVAFSPSQLGLIQDGPSTRRHFVDTCISQLSPKYISLLADYNRVLLQRGSLLKDISYSAFLLDTLDIWDEKLVELAALVVQQRSRYLEKMAVHAQEIYHEIAAKKETLRMRYNAAGLEESAAEYKSWYARALRQNRAEDIRQGATTAGPHRDDIEFEINGKSVRSYGSQGQQRSAVLAMKLAEGRLMKELLRDDPVILLDDVMSELDQSRQEYLLNHLKDCQVFITCCDKSSFEALRSGRAFHMAGGALTAEQAE